MKKIKLGQAYRITFYKNSTGFTPNAYYVIQEKFITSRGIFYRFKGYNLLWHEDDFGILG